MHAKGWLMALAGMLLLPPLAFAQPAFTVVPLGVQGGLSEGNLGTAFRHRGEIVWAVAILAAWGARSLAAWWLTTSDD